MIGHHPPFPPLFQVESCVFFDSEFIRSQRPSYSLFPRSSHRLVEQLGMRPLAISSGVRILIRIHLPQVPQRRLSHPLRVELSTSPCSPLFLPI